MHKNNKNHNILVFIHFFSPLYSMQTERKMCLDLQFANYVCNQANHQLFKTYKKYTFEM